MLLRYVVVSGSFLWHAGAVRCDATQVVAPNLEKVVDVQYQRNNAVPVPANAEEISKFIDRSLEDVPESSTAVPEFSKSKLRDDLRARLREQPSGAATQGEAAWKKCLDDSQARVEKGFGELTARIIRFACGPAWNRDQIVMALLLAWTTAKLSETPVAKALASALLQDDEKCPAGTLRETTRQSLRDAMSRPD
jgi:hypothetical protein